MHYSQKYMRKMSIIPNGEDESVDSNEAAKLIRSGFQMQEEVEYTSLLEDLEALETWCKRTNNPSKDAFFKFYQDAVIGAYYRYMRTKEKAWSRKKNLLQTTCTVILPGISALLPAVSGFVVPRIMGETDAVWGLSGLLACSAIAVFWVVTSVYHEWGKRRAYDETWVRHSVCYARLHLALSAFIASEQSDKDYQTFYSTTFAVLEQNYDQFTLNLSARGTAPRPGSASKKG